MAEESLKAIEDCVGLYFDGLYRSDRALLEKAFHPNASVIGYSSDGKLNLMALETFLGFVDTVPSPQDAGSEYDMEILSVDATPTTASVKVRDLYLGRDFIDHLHLAREGETWRIVSKLFHSEKRG